MTVIVFLIDNSASMNQRTYLGTSLLDIAKNCVEEIFKIRLKFSRSDRYFIFSLDKEPNELKSTESKQNLHVIRAALDAIKPNGYTSIGIGIRRTFDMLNLMRMNNGYENYGMGRYPSQIEHAIVICITDGGKLTSESGILNGELTLPVLLPGIHGEEFTSEPFRWDYRLYSIVLRFPAFNSEPIESQKFIPTDEDCPISAMCEVTGGRAYKITNERMLHQCLESLSQKCQPGVVLHFTKLDENVENSKPEPQRWHTCKKMIYVKSSSINAASSHWPIPESFWPDEHLNDKLPPRTAHPIVCFSTQKMPVPKIMEHFPLDRYELEPSPLTQYILERRDSNFVWHCYVPKSGKTQDYPFGYLKPSSDLQSVHIYVLSYNFPALIDLLNSLSDTFKMRINDTWGSKFAHYLGIIPKYYFSPLAKAFEKIGLPFLIKQESIERILSYNLKTNLQKLRQNAKVQLEQRYGAPEKKSFVFRGTNLLKRSILQRNGGSLDTVGLSVVSVKMPRLDINSYLNPKRVDRASLRTMVQKSVKNFRSYALTNVKLMERESINEQPMSEMGDYANYKYGKLMEPLKEINPAPERTDKFGNPFRRKSSTYTFEADEKFVEDMMSGGEGSKLTRRPCNTEMGRTKGPLPLNITYYNWRRSPSSAGSSPLHCPTSPVPCDMGIETEHVEVKILNGFKEETVIIPPMKSPTVGDLKDHYYHNRVLVKKLITVLRHPKIDGGVVFKLLTKFQGPYKLQSVMINKCLHQSIQFKRIEISNLIKQYLTYLKKQNGMYKNNNKINLVNGHVNL